MAARAPGVGGVLRRAGHGALGAAPDDGALGALRAGEDAAIRVAAARGRRVAAVLDVRVRVREAPAAGLTLAARAVEGVSHEVADLALGHPAERVRRRSVAGALDEGADGESGGGALGGDRLGRCPRVDHGGRRRGRDLDDDRGVAVAGHHVVRRRRVLHVARRVGRSAVGVGVGGVGGDRRIRAAVARDGRLVAGGAARVGVARVDDVRRVRIGRAAVRRGPRVGGLGEVGAPVHGVDHAVAVGVPVGAAVAVGVVDLRGCDDRTPVAAVAHAVAVAVTVGAARSRRVGVVADRDRRALVCLVEDAVAVVVLPVGEDRGRRRDRRDDDRRGAADPLRVGLDAVADRKPGADVVAVEDAVAVEVASGAAGPRGVGGPTRRHGDALVRVVADSVAVLVTVAAAREGGAGGEADGERGEQTRLRGVHSGTSSGMFET